MPARAFLVDGKHLRPGPLAERQSPDDPLQETALRRVAAAQQDRSFCLDQRQADRPVAKFAGRMHKQYGIVANNEVGPEAFKDRADAGHAEFVQFGSAQRAKAGGPQHSHTMCHQIENFLVPHRRRRLKAAVDQPDGGRRIGQEASEIARDRRRTKLDTIRYPNLSERRARKQDPARRDCSARHNHPLRSCPSGSVATFGQAQAR